MFKITRFVIWICSKFTRAEIEQIIAGLSDVLSNHNPEVKPKDDFKEKHPNYRVFSVDPLPPLTEPSAKQPVQPAKDYKLILAQYQADHGNIFRPVKQRPNSPKVPSLTVCPVCNAPHIYLYFNDGSKRSQLKCKVCSHLFQLNQRFRKNEKSKYFCLFCHPLLRQRNLVSCSFHKIHLVFHKTFDIISIILHIVFCSVHEIKRRGNAPPFFINYFGAFTSAIAFSRNFTPSIEVCMDSKSDVFAASGL